MKRKIAILLVAVFMIVLCPLIVKASALEEEPEQPDTSETGSKLKITPDVLSDTGGAIRGITAAYHADILTPKGERLANERRQYREKQSRQLQDELFTNPDAGNESLHMYVKTQSNQYGLFSDVPEYELSPEAESFLLSRNLLFAVIAVLGAIVSFVAAKAYTKHKTRGK